MLVRKSLSFGRRRLSWECLGFYTMVKIMTKTRDKKKDEE